MAIMSASEFAVWLGGGTPQVEYSPGEMASDVFRVPVSFGKFYLVFSNTNQNTVSVNPSVFYSGDIEFTRPTVADTVRISTVVRDTVYLTSSPQGGGPFDGFYVLNGLRITNPIGITTDYQYPAITGSLKIQD